MDCLIILEPITGEVPPSQNLLLWLFRTREQQPGRGKEVRANERNLDRLGSGNFND
jgi:hypothetical protein